jgi:hypothetical protein
MTGDTIRISELPGAGVLSGTELVPLVKDGVTSLRSVQNIVQEGGLTLHTNASDPHTQYALRLLNNLSATTDPSVSNDSSEGYAVLSRWVNVSTGEVWLCVGNSVGSANWQTATLSISDLGSAAVADTGAGNGLDADLLDGEQGTFFLDFPNFTNVPANTIANVDGLADALDTLSAQNSTDAELRDRSSHTGTQGVATITGLSDAATTTVSTIRSGTTKSDVGLSNVVNVESYSKVESDAILSSLATTSVSTTAISKTIEIGEQCFVTAATLTITLPLSPTVNALVAVGVQAFEDTVIARNGENIMSLSENLVVNVENTVVTLLYVNASEGWRIV